MILQPPPQTNTLEHTLITHPRAHLLDVEAAALEVRAELGDALLVPLQIPLRLVHLVDHHNQIADWRQER